MSGQRVRVDAAWWSLHLSQRGLPGGPLDVTDDEGGAQYITRAGVWAHAADVAADDDAVLRLLWHSLAWGAGLRVRNEPRRMDAVVADVPRAVTLLRAAADLARVSPEQAFALLHPNGRGALRHLGPAFGTKFLYFAGGGDPDHPCYILDARVAAALRSLGWTSLGTRGGWGAVTYARYCALLARWAGELSSHGPTQVTGDQIEKWLFDRKPLGAVSSSSKG